MKRIITIIILLFLIVLSVSCSRNTQIYTNNTPATPTNSIPSATPIRNENSNLSVTKNSSNNVDNNKLSLIDLQDKGYKIIEDQSFNIELENWGKVKFVSMEEHIKGPTHLHLYLVDNNNEILYTLPDAKYKWNLYEVKAVAFRDVNNDGLKDIILISDFMTGVGENGAIPFRVSNIFFQKDKEFINLPDIDNKINQANQNESIDIVLEYLEKLKSNGIQLNIFDNVSQEIFFGQWIIKKKVAYARVGVYGDKDINSMIGREMSFSKEKSSCFGDNINNLNKTAYNPKYEKIVLSKTEFEQENNITFEQLGIKSESIVQVNAGDSNYNGCSFFIKDDNTLILVGGGVYLELDRK